MSKVAKTTIMLMIVTILSKILGFGRELVLGYMYGATSYSDIYITAMNIPNVLFVSIGMAISTTFIPLYYENRDIGGKEAGIKFTNNIFNIILLLGVILSLLGFIFANPLVKVFAIGFEDEILNHTIKFTRIMIFGGLMVILSYIMTSFLQTQDEFIVPVIATIPFNIIIIISIILSGKTSIYILPIGTLIAMFMQYFFQVPFAYKYGYKYKPKINLKDKYVKKIIWLVLPVFIGVAVNQVNTIVDRTLASTLVEGSISALNYANKLNGFVTTLFIMSISAVIYPTLSKLSIQGERELFVESVRKSVNSVILLVIPISVGAIVLSKPIVKLLFERGAFDDRATYMTSITLVFYSIGMIGVGLRDILGKIFYSLQDTKTPMVNGVLAVGINIVLNLILVKYIKYAGLAFATSISAIICTFLLFRSLQRKIGYYGQDLIINTIIKSIIASIFMGVVTILFYNSLSRVLDGVLIGQAISVFTSIAIGAITYVIAIILLKIEEISEMLNLIKIKLKSRRS